MKHLLLLIILIIPLYSFSQRVLEHSNIQRPVGAQGILTHDTILYYAMYDFAKTVKPDYRVYVNSSMPIYHLNDSTLSFTIKNYIGNIGVSRTFNKVKDNEWESTVYAEIGYQTFEDIKGRLHKANTVSVGYGLGNEWAWTVGLRLSGFWQSFESYNMSASVHGDFTPFEPRRVNVSFILDAGVLLGKSDKATAYIAPGIQVAYRL